MGELPFRKHAVCVRPQPGVRGPRRRRVGAVAVGPLCFADGRKHQ
jgi:hypothetical protein